ncbi:hypothetical protein G7046_g1276 [Stylonectria norvegica]|nr:hypothetical protein G7046_g1276 [Stylonectria norvegica]
MRSFTFLAALIGAAAAAPLTSNNVHFPRGSLTAGGFTKVTPGGIDDVVVTADNTLNGTVHTGKEHIILSRSAIKANLPISFVNNFGGSGNVKAYIQGLDSSNAIVFIAADGSLVYPTSGGSKSPVKVTQNIAIPLGAKGSTLNFNLPIEMHSGRVYFANGDLSFFMVATDNGDGLVQPSAVNPSDPSAGLNWGFVELTYTGGVLFSNISYVDFVGMILGMQLTVKNGATQIAKGLDAAGVSKICNDLSAQKSADGFPWTSLCMADSTGTPVRILAPIDYYDLNNNAFASYWTSYVDQVYAKYSSTPLVIDTQGAAGAGVGKINCRVTNNVMNCDGDNRGYPKPAQKDIWGCSSGAFAQLGGDNAVHIAVIPRLCAAFSRSTLLLNGGGVQPSVAQSSYYTVNPTHHYSRLVHKYEPDGRGYAFSFDDVNPNNDDNASGVLSSASPNVLTLSIGAPFA